MQLQLQMIKRILSISVICILLNGCLNPYDFWNGVSSGDRIVEEARKEREDFYNAESPEMKKMREKNYHICKKKEAYDACMAKLGTPVFSYKKNSVK